MLKKGAKTSSDILQNYGCSRCGKNQELTNCFLCGNSSCINCIEKCNECGKVCCSLCSEKK